MPNHCDLCEFDQKLGNLHEREVNGTKLYVCNSVRICLMRIIMNTPLKELYPTYDAMLEQYIAQRP